ncbi:peptide-methionine (S)-S-oxide reductase [candidate division WWE3 bacterium RIFCSPHIGHO2_01_FULL_40_23]|uniref:Peptide methionine sulfoxide reductase MsrA n=1 Tax=candidate division WWE3 bacterium RIFCSPLOWO2_01_FULL_41_18 TaxID=1802625 RepID=A0A1F4VD92_UNCKA|nr:MAG: peptide-methionine (S)-S-oxide reductase [candidate division WWE3 bacterium RIFCSPHIGHO2_01_FULL_40_23]OGC55119.1 MAG: peptide-methionine (S)-S-oxide reductase [candidate division WWE3 bacterium RIFCSPLOWO2_01_FULL_41_18]
MEENKSENLEEAVFGGGCFWCVEATYQRLKGIYSVESGYSGGETENPKYEEVSRGDSGHAEVILIKFNPREIPYRTLLDVFFDVHDPTTLNRQGNDVGTQYRSVIFYTNEKQMREAMKKIEELNKGSEPGKPITTSLEPFRGFYKAESYHQNYFNNNPGNAYCSIVIVPKLKKFREKYASFLDPRLDRG